VQIWTVGQVNGVASSYDVAEGCNTQDADMLKYALGNAPFRVPVVCNGNMSHCMRAWAGSARLQANGQPVTRNRGHSKDPA
jgi:hypothetical protein